MDTLEINPTPLMIEKYRALLLEDWSRTSFETTLELIREMIGDPVPGICTNDADAGEGGCTRTNLAALERIRLLGKSLRVEAIPVIVDSVHPSLNESDRSLEAAMVSLILQSLYTVRGNVGFLADTQSILFHNCVDVLLPELDERDQQVNRAWLLNALYVHTFLCWHSMPAHMYYLQSILMGYLDVWPEYLQLKRYSLWLTPPTNHEFITKAQDIWSILLDHEEYQAASGFLLDTFGMARNDDKAEIKELMWLTPRPNGLPWNRTQTNSLVPY